MNRFFSIAAFALLAGAAAAADTALDQKLIGVRRDLHRHPELAYQETRTLQRIAEFLKAAGFSDVKTGVAKTGVVATLVGGKPGPVVAVRVAMDAFPVQEKRESEYKSLAPNVSHACGHDAMMAMALGAAELLARERERLAGTVRFVFQPAEEGPPAGEENAAPVMLREGAYKDAAAVIAFHVDSDIPAGRYGLQPNTVYAGADVIEGTVTGAAAHAAMPWDGVDAIAVAGQVVSGLQLVASRQTPIWDPIVLTLGTLSGGERSNALAAEARFSGTLRTYSLESRDKARAAVQRIVERVSDAYGAKGTVKFSDELPPVVNAAALYLKLRPVLQAEAGQGNLNILMPLPYADDFGFVSQAIPSFYYQVGTRNDKKGISSPTRSENFDVDETVIPAGARMAAKLVLAALGN